MAKRPSLSRSEMEVARIVWDLDGGTVRQVREAMPREIEYKTLQTYLRRLESKGYVTARRGGRSIHYSPRAKRRRVIQDTVQDFVGQLFGGQAMPLVEHLIQDQNLSRSEIHKLRELLDRLDEEQDNV